MAANQKTDWDTIEPTSNGCSPIIESIVLEITNLNNTIKDLLHIEALKEIMKQIYMFYTERLQTEYSKIVVCTVKGKQNLIADVTFFTSKYSLLDGVDLLSNELLVFVEHIPIQTNLTSSTIPSNKSSTSPIQATTAKSLFGKFMKSNNKS
jgi:hypothetical protein